MLSVPVVAELWQFGCCGTPFTVGDEVEWTLRFGEPFDWLNEETIVTTLDGRAEAFEERFTVLRSGGLTAFWEGSGKSHGAVQVRGLLREDHHGAVPDNLPETMGTVEEVSTIIGQFESADGTSWKPLPHTATLRPRRSMWDTVPTGPRTRHGDKQRHVGEFAILARLAIGDP
jgi:hypothetical protein